MIASTRILLLGLDPETVDFSDPALPPGMTAEKVRAGIAVALKQFTDEFTAKLTVPKRLGAASDDHTGKGRGYGSGFRPIQIDSAKCLTD